MLNANPRLKLVPERLIPYSQSHDIEVRGHSSYKYSGLVGHKPVQWRSPFHGIPI